MPVICPSVTAADAGTYRRQMEKVAVFAERIQIDLTDSDFAKGADISPADAWWPVGIAADFHLMYRHPDAAIETILEHKPNLVIVHAEAEGNFVGFAEKLKSLGVKSGVALLPKTSAESILSGLGHIDHVLIFSGDLGSYGGHADLGLLSKAQLLKQYKPSLEIGWDGGVNDQNISRLANGGIDVFNVGGFLQEAADAERAYHALLRIAEETGTT